MSKNTKQIRFLSGALILIAAVISLAACASQPAVPAQGQSAPATQASVAKTSGAAPASGASSGAVAGSVASFSKDILPLMQTACISCHGGEKTSKGLDLKTYASTMTGSQNGAVIVPGDASNSKLIQSVESGKMPKRGSKLTADQIQQLVDWVNAGAANN